MMMKILQKMKNKNYFVKI